MGLSSCNNCIVTGYFNQRITPVKRLDKIKTIKY